MSYIIYIIYSKNANITCFKEDTTKYCKIANEITKTNMTTYFGRKIDVRLT